MKLAWVKAHMGILGNEAANVLAKKATEGVPLDDHEKWMSGGGIRQWVKWRKRECGVRRGWGYPKSDGMEEDCSNELV